MARLLLQWLLERLPSRSFDGFSHLVLPGQVDPGQVAANSISVCVTQRLGTLVDDQFGAALKPLKAELKSPGVWASDLAGFASMLESPIRQASSMFIELRRAKGED